MLGAAPGIAQEEAGIIGDVGSKSVRLALTDRSGAPDFETLRSYDVTTQPTFSGIVTQFARDAGLTVLPRHCALAIAGAPRGDAMTLPNSRMLVSRTGLQSMLREAPIIINECAATAWALTSARSSDFECVSGRVPSPAAGAGVYCVFSVGTGLGVAVLQRDETGHCTVLATEAGHCGFAPESDEDAELVEIVRRSSRRVSAEALLSAPGLVRLYAAVAAMQDSSASLSRPEEVTEAASRRDPVACKTITAFGRMLWSYAGNKVLSYGAWDGMFVTGTIARVLRSSLRGREAWSAFFVRNPYQRQLEAVPLNLATIEYAELKGAAQALRSHSNQLRHTGSEHPTLN